MNKTAIGWTDFSANPLKYRDAEGRTVWACVHASPGCQHCYAETLAKRYRKGGPFNAPTTAEVTPFLDEKELHRMLTYKPASGKRCFIGDMTDIFGEWVPDEMLDQLFAVMTIRKDVVWQVLTKRADRLRRYMTSGRSEQGMEGRFGALIDASFELERAGIVKRFMRDGRGGWFPMTNVWLGVSAEDQQRLDDRIHHLQNTPAAVRFMSIEPLIDSVDLTRCWELTEVGYIDALRGFSGSEPAIPGLDWVIVGGESGPKARPCDVQWVRSVIHQCRSASVPVFCKQLGSRPIGWWSNSLGPRMPTTFADHKGANPSEWPGDLRVQEFPIRAWAGR